MKLKTTKKSIKEESKENGKKIIKIGYCNLQTLLSGIDPFAYTAGVNGWACDYYEIGGVIISTGYGPIGEDIDYELIREYEKKSENIKYSNIAYEEKTKQIYILLNEFIKEIKK